MSNADLVVIGGGINGCGIARDAALRGLSVVLVEQQDIGGGTSAASTKLIHGGLRYLEHLELPLVYESLHEREYLLNAAPHLVRALEFVIPIYRGGAYSRTTVGIGLTLYDILTGLGTKVPRHRSVSRAEMLAAMPSLDGVGLRGGFAYHDGQVTYPERLALENLLHAHEAGCEVFTRTRVTGFIQEGADISGVVVHDVDAGEERRIPAGIVVNASGPWVDGLLGLVRGAYDDRMGGTRGMHVLLPRKQGGPECALYTPARADGRPFFVVPWREYYWVGTTDIPHEDPETAHPTDKERDYLLNEVNQLLPDLRYTPDDVLYSLTGVRPLPKHDFEKPGAITRRHIIFDHKREDGVAGLLSIIGGKLTTYRKLAQEVVDEVYGRLGREPVACTTREEPLPGAGSVRRPDGVADGLWDYLYSLYGSQAGAVLDLAAERSELRAPLCVDLPDIAAQVVWSCRHEFCMHIDDFMLRRSGIGTGHTEGLTCLDAVADIMMVELGWTQDQRDADIQQYRDVIGRHHRVAPAELGDPMRGE